MSELNNKIEKQEEKTGKKRDIIKNIAIIFLAVMLVLTFFSNTIMNYSLPQVSTEQIMNGTIKNQVRGKGIIEVVDPYNVVVEETRTVSSVRVQEGDYVNEGDVIYTLKGEESEELEEAKKALEEAELAYKKGLLSGDISPQAEDVDLETVKRTIAAFNATIDAADNEIQNHSAKLNEYKRQLTELGKSSTTDKWEVEKVKADKRIQDADARIDAAQKKFDDANEILKTDPDSEAEKKRQYHRDNRDEASNRMTTCLPIENEYQAAIAAGSEPTAEQKAGHESYEAAVKDYEAALKVIEEDEKAFKQAPKEKEAAEKEKEAAQKEKDSAQKAYNEAKYQIELLTAQGATDSNQAKRNELNAAIEYEEGMVKVAEEKKTLTEAKRDEYKDEVLGKVSAVAKVEEILDLQEKVEKLQKKALGGEITSPVTGRIISLSKSSGEKVEAKDTVATIQVEGKGYQCTLTADAKQAKTVKVGDEVKIEDYYYYNVTAKLVNILPDKSDPKNKRSLVFELEGDDLYEGGSISLAVGESNSRYDLTIPKSALGKDNKGDYILVLVPKQVPFGTRYIAKRVEVTSILATDDSRAAIEAEVDSWGTYVITNATRPVNPGEQVRLAEEKN